MCFLNEQYLFVTGSYVRDENVCATCERYDIKMNRFANFPPMNVGRCHHSSCSFDQRYIFVFCGLVIVKTEQEEVSEQDRGMTIITEKLRWEPSASIERFDSTKKFEGWSTISIPVSPLTPRRTPGVVQTSPTEILIFGGFARNKDLRATYRFNTYTETIVKYAKVSG